MEEKSQKAAGTTDFGLQKLLRAGGGVTEITLPKESRWRFRGLKRGYVMPQRDRKVLLMNYEEKKLYIKWLYDNTDEQRRVFLSILLSMIKPVKVEKDTVILSELAGYYLRNRILSFEETDVGLLIKSKRREKRS